MDIMLDVYSCTFLKKKYKFFQLETVRISKLKGQNAYHDGLTDIMVDNEHYLMGIWYAPPFPLLHLLQGLHGIRALLQHTPKRRALPP